MQLDFIKPPKAKKPQKKRDLRDQDTAETRSDQPQENKSQDNAIQSNSAISSEQSAQPPKVLDETCYLAKNTRFFLIKSYNHENVELAKSKNVWSTPKSNAIKLNKSYRECANVILIFSVAESGRFQGFARLADECRYDSHLQVDWVLPPNLTAKSLMGIFKIDWIAKNDLSFTKTQHLLNQFNENRPVKIGRDGQEIDPQTGESLCRLFNEEKENSNWPSLSNAESTTSESRSQRSSDSRNHRKYNPSYNNQQRSHQYQNQPHQNYNNRDYNNHNHANSNRHNNSSRNYSVHGHQQSLSNFAPHIQYNALQPHQTIIYGPMPNGAVTYPPAQFYDPMHQMQYMGQGYVYNGGLGDPNLSPSKRHFHDTNRAFTNIPKEVVLYDTYQEYLAAAAAGTVQSAIPPEQTT